LEKALLEKVSFEVRTGEKVAIVGPNGTGKTTLLRALRENRNSAITFAPEAKVAFFSQLQEEVLCGENSILQEFLDLGFETREAVEEHLGRYCFESDGLHRNVGQLSGGEKNLLQLARLEVSGANLLLLDEPSSHLDTYAQIALEKAIRAYRGAVIMVSHDFYSIVNSADSILVMEDGSLRPMTGRAFRKRIYKNHFSKEYLELDLRRQELESRIQKALGEKDHETAKTLCQELEQVVSEM
jgi:ATP-binding cassette subfamily F protein 3